VDWLRAQPISELATTAVNVAEIRYGLARLSFGRRRTELENTFANFVTRGFGNRVLAVDAAAASVYGEIAAARERRGRRLGGFHGLIAAVALSHGLPLATRDIDDFADCGLALINPWNGTTGS
jgi:predicted nucleic acid-binding protein